MTCSQVATLLDTFLDGELPPEQTLALEEHVASCSACQERMRFDGALRTSTKRAVESVAEMAPGFEARLAGALRAERERLLERKPSIAPRPTPKKIGSTPLWLAAAVVLGAFLWFGDRAPRGSEAASVAAVPPAPERDTALAMQTETPEQALDDLVRYHAAPPEPQITEPRLVERLEPEVGVPVHLPALKQYGASWEGGGVVPMKNQRAALFRYRVSNHPVTVYVYDAKRLPLRSVLEPRVVHNQPVHVGERHGYSIAALEQRGVGYAVATDLNDDESAELVTTMY